ncbi:MAG: phosphotransferase [Anaerolineales bacterium]|nr:phosphotransferase [Anaerolineales bacterium]
MDPQIAALINEDILSAARQCYAIAPDRLKLLDGFESFIYEFNRPDGDYVLRLGHSRRRSPDLIRGEVEWINYLADGGVTVARAVLSTAGELVEPLDDGQGGQFLCTAFVKARGGIARKEQINARLFHNYGCLLGRMHALAKTYTPSNPAWKRYAWDSPENSTPDRQLSKDETLIREKYRALLAHLRTLPCDRDGYGMIHQDAHLGNLFVDENYTLTLFDFDDCVYGHFIYDIAMVLFYVSMGEKKDPAGFTGRFMPIFLQGYREHNRLDPAWLPEIPNFLKLREIDLFAAILFAFGERPDDEWCAGYLEGRRKRIENDMPYIDFHWELLAPYL